MRFLRGDVGSFRDDLGHHTSYGFDTEGQWGGVDNDQAFSLFGFFTADDTSLDGSAGANSFVGVDSGVRVFSVEEVLYDLSDLRDTGGPSHQYDLVDFGFLQAAVVQSDLHRLHCFLEQVGVQFLEPGSGQYLAEIVALGEVLDFDLDFVRRREGSFLFLDFPL